MNSQLPNQPQLKVRQSCNVFFKPSILPKNKQTNSGFLPYITMIELFLLVFWKNSMIAKSCFEIMVFPYIIVSSLNYVTPLIVYPFLKKLST